MKCETNWEDDEPQLKRVMAASPVGAKMFWAGAEYLQHSRSVAIIKKSIDKLGEQIDETVLTDSLQQVRAELSNVGVDINEVFKKRKCSCVYRGVTLMTYVTSYLDEWEIRKEAHVRSMAVSGGFLDPIFCEGELVPLVRVAGAKVDPTLLTATKLARAAMLDFIPNTSEQTSANIKNMIAMRAMALCQCDRFARIDMLFFESFMDEGAESRMHDAILQCFPTQGDGVTEELCSQRLRGLAQSKLVSFVGVGLGSLVTVILDVMTTLVDGCHPKWEQVTQTDFIKRVKARMGYFLQYEVVGG